MVRVFEDSEVTHVEGAVDPVRDLEIIGEELRLKDEERITAVVEDLEPKVRRAGKTGPKEMQNELTCMQKVLAFVKDQKKPVRVGDWTTAEIEFLNKHLLLTAKPVLYLVNMTENDFIKKKNKWLPKIKAWIDENDPGAQLIPISASLESKLLNGETFVDEKGLAIPSSLPKVIKAGYHLLQLIYFFTVGSDEVKAWTIRKGTTAPQAGGQIHTDFEKYFVCAEIMSYEDLKAAGSESAVKAAGKYKQKGRAYIVEDGDIILFHNNPPGSGAKKK
jgi:obg-like ATPase 1